MSLENFVGLYEGWRDVAETTQALAQDPHNPQLYNKVNELTRGLPGELQPVTLETNPAAVRNILNASGAIKRRQTESYITANLESLVGEAADENLAALLGISPSPIEGYEEIAKLHQAYLYRKIVYEGLKSKDKEKRERASVVLSSMREILVDDIITRENEKQTPGKRLTADEIKMFRDAILATGYLPVEYAEKNFEREANELLEQLKGKSGKVKDYVVESFKASKEKEPFYMALYQAGKKEEKKPEER